MIENFIEYMWYLLTAPFKRVKKGVNKWYILCRVFGKRFDEAKEDIMRARDEGMVATCSHEMLQLHGADRKITRYVGETLENYRSRIAMWEELYKLGGTNEGILLALRTLGYSSPELVRANDLTGFRCIILDGSWTLDGSLTLGYDNNSSENRWAEFYVVIVMDAGEEHPISFDIMRMVVRQWKEVGAKDNYFFRYNLVITETHNMRFIHALYKNHLYYFDYLKTDGRWQLDGSYTLDAEISPRGMTWTAAFQHWYTEHISLEQWYQLQACKEQYNIQRTLDQYMMVIHPRDKTKTNCIIRADYSLGAYHQPEDYRVIWHEEHNLIYLDGTWSLDGSKTIDAWQKTEVL